MKLSNELVKFADGNTDFYVGFAEYYMKKEKTHEEKEAINQAFFAEVAEKSGIKAEGLAVDALVSNPSYKWAFMAVVDATINAVLPQVLTPAFELFMDMRFLEAGDVYKFKVMPNHLYTVSKGGRGERTTNRQKDFAADITLSPVEHIVTVYTDLYRVMAGKEDIADFLGRVVLAIEQAMYGDALKALTAGLTAIPRGAYNVTGPFDAKALLKMCETIEANNGGAKPYIIGPATALMDVLPDSVLGFRGVYQAEGAVIDVTKDFYGFPVMKLKQAVGGNGELVLPEDKIYVISPSLDKLVKGAVSNSLSNSNQAYDNADLTSNFTMRKNWDFQYASAVKAGIFTISE